MYRYLINKFKYCNIISLNVRAIFSVKIKIYNLSEQTFKII